MANQKTNYELANEAVAKSIKGTKIIGQTISTGTSYFEGKTRLLKVLNTKKGISLEVNVILSKEIEEEYSLEKISYATAYKKHLGTMKYMVKLNDDKNLLKLIKAAVEEFKKSNQEVKQEQAQ